MLRTAMHRRPLALVLSLVLLLTQQLGALHLLSHVLHPSSPAAVLDASTPPAVLHTSTPATVLPTSTPPAVLLQPGHDSSGLVATVVVGAPETHPGHGVDAGHTSHAADALCQVCLVLATLGAATLPAQWQGVAHHLQAAVPPAPPHPAPSRLAPAPYHARGPPVSARLT